MCNGMDILKLRAQLFETWTRKKRMTITTYLLKNSEKNNNIYDSNIDYKFKFQQITGHTGDTFPLLLYRYRLFHSSKFQSLRMAPRLFRTLFCQFWK